MLSKKMLVSGLLGVVLLLASTARAQDFVRSEVSVQGTGFFTKDSQQNGTLQHSTDTGGVLATYRYHFNSWLAAEASYGYQRNTQQNFTPGGEFGIQANVHRGNRSTGCQSSFLHSEAEALRPGGSGSFGIRSYS